MLRKRFLQQRQPSRLVNPAVYENQLEELGQHLRQSLQQRSPWLQLQIRCAAKQDTLLILIEHLLHIEPDPAITFADVEAALPEKAGELFQSGFAKSLVGDARSIPVRAFLRISGYQQPYAVHSFALEPSPIASPAVETPLAAEIPLAQPLPAEEKPPVAPYSNTATVFQDVANAPAVDRSSVVEDAPLVDGYQPEAIAAAPAVEAGESEAMVPASEFVASVDAEEIVSEVPPAEQSTTSEPILAATTVLPEANALIEILPDEVTELESSSLPIESDSSEPDVAIEFDSSETDLVSPEVVSAEPTVVSSAEEIRELSEFEEPIVEPLAAELVEAETIAEISSTEILAAEPTDVQPEANSETTISELTTTEVEPAAELPIVELSEGEAGLPVQLDEIQPETILDASPIELEVIASQREAATEISSAELEEDLPDESAEIELTTIEEIPATERDTSESEQIEPETIPAIPSAELEPSEPETIATVSPVELDEVELGTSEEAISAELAEAEESNEILSTEFNVIEPEATAQALPVEEIELKATTEVTVEPALADVTEAEAIAELPSVDVVEAEAIAESPLVDVIEAEVIAESPLVEVTEAEAIAESPSVDVVEAETIVEPALADVAEVEAIAESPSVDVAETSAIVELPPADVIPVEVIAESPSVDVAQSEAIIELPPTDILAVEVIAESPSVDVVAAEVIAESPSVDVAEPEAIIELPPTDVILVEVIAESSSVDLVQPETIVEPPPADVVPVEVIAKPALTDVVAAEVIAESPSVDVAEPEAIVEPPPANISAAEVIVEPPLTESTSESTSVEPAVFSNTSTNLLPLQPTPSFTEVPTDLVTAAIINGQPKETKPPEEIASVSAPPPALEHKVISTEQLVSPTRSRWSASSVMLAGSVGLFAIVSGAYILTRPCVLGSVCEPLQRAQQLDQQANQTITSTESALEIAEAYDQLNEARTLLGTIPAWSGQYQTAQALQSDYDSKAEVLEQVVQALKKANTAALSSQNPPHPLQDWRKIQWNWREAIALLKKVPPESPVAALAQKKLQEYQVNLNNTDARVMAEQAAQDKVTTARSTAQVAETRAGAATSPEGWQQVYLTWEAAIDLLRQVPEGTMAHVEAQKLVADYQTKMVAARERRSQEAFSTGSLQEAIDFAEQARGLEQQNKWAEASLTWQQALNKVQRIPEGTSYYSRAQALMSQYQAALSGAQQNERRLSAMQKIKPNLDRTCAGNPRVCTYTFAPEAVRVQITPEYDQVIEGRINSSQLRGNVSARTQAVNQVNQLLVELSSLSQTAQVPIELYNSNGSKFGTHAPNPFAQ
ncbi:hypothetical protein IFO70_19445 [Phormidium tenue FACHB-886]|nr:hypothetical protein [Phormidium tenue FACHB-886]